MHETHRHHADAPHQHDGRDEDGRAKTLEEDLGERLKERVGDEEDCQRNVVLGVGHLEVLLQALDLGIANVGAVEEGNEVEEAEPWN